MTIWVFLIIGCIFLSNAVCIASTAAIERLRRNPGGLLPKIPSAKHSAFDLFLAHPDLSLVTFQTASIALTLLLGAGAGVFLFSNRYLGAFPSAPHIRIVCAAMVSLLYIILGFALPQAVGRQKPQHIFHFLLKPLRFPVLALRPLTSAVHGLTSTIVTIFGLDPGEDRGTHLNEAEFIALLNRSHKEGAFTKQEVSLIENVLEFTDTRSREIMVPRKDVVFLDIAKPLEENLHIAYTCGHTRLPLCDESLDNLIGMVHIKDLFTHMQSKDHLRSLRAIAREMVCVPENMPIGKLLLQFQKSRIHMAVVTDEYSSASGVVTLENILEELVGEIQDEFDRETPEIQKIAPNEYLIRGTVLTKELEDVLDLSLPDTPVDTIGGLVAATLQRIPEKGDCIQLEACELVVEEVHERAVSRLLLKRALSPSSI